VGSLNSVFGGESWSDDDDKDKDELCLLRSSLAIQNHLSRDSVPLVRLTSFLIDLILTIDSVDA